MSISRKIKMHMENQSWIRRMFEEGMHLKKLHGSENVFDFSLGVPLVDPPDQVLATLKEIATSNGGGVHTYMANRGFADVRSEIASYLSKETGIGLTENHIVMTVGAAGGINIVLKAILDPGDEVIVLAPYFVEYPFYIDNHAGKPVIVETNEDFSLDLAAIDRAINPNTKAIIVNSPNNPTGVVYDDTSLIELAELLTQRSKKFGKPIHILSDEVYRRLVYDDVVPANLLEIYENSLILYSFSKDLSLAGERIGYVVINPRTEFADEIYSALIFCTRTLGFVNAPALMQRLVKETLDCCVDVDDYDEKRNLFYESLVEFGYSVIKPQGTFYLFPKSFIADDVAFINELKEKNILATPGSGFGRKGHFRLTYCVSKNVIERALPGFKELAEKYAAVITG